MKIPSLPVLLMLATLGLLMSCGQTKEPTKSAEPASAATPSPEEMNRILQRVEGDQLGDSTMFPFVYQGAGQSNLFEAYTMKFSLNYEDPLRPMTNDLVSWINPENYNENNGIFLTYVRNGREITLTNPYIQLQYINKNLPYCSTVDSIYIWMDQAQLKAPDAKVLKEYTLDTKAGIPAICKDYFSGNPPQRQAKHLAYAYVDYNETYFIGLALTTTTAEDFAENRPLFVNMVQSFAKP